MSVFRRLPGVPGAPYRRKPRHGTSSQVQRVLLSPQIPPLVAASAWISLIGIIKKYFLSNVNVFSFFP